MRLIGGWHKLICIYLGWYCHITPTVCSVDLITVLLPLLCCHYNTMALAVYRCILRPVYYYHHHLTAASKYAKLIMWALYCNLLERESLCLDVSLCGTPEASRTAHKLCSVHPLIHHWLPNVITKWGWGRRGISKEWRLVLSLVYRGFWFENVTFLSSAIPALLESGRGN